MTTTNTADVDLDKLAAIARRVGERGLFNASCDILDWIQDVHTTLARRSSPAGAGADERAQRYGAALIEYARQSGWDEQGDEGAFEYVQRLSYELGENDARAAQAQPASQQGEPVAAQYKFPGEVWEECATEEVDAMRARGCEVRYLYAAPVSALAQPAAGQQAAWEAHVAKRTDYPNPRDQGFFEAGYRAALTQPSAGAQGDERATEPGPWNVQGEDDKIDASRLLDVVLTNGVTLERATFSKIDWTQVADWRYSAAAPAAPAAPLEKDGVLVLIEETAERMAKQLDKVTEIAKERRDDLLADMTDTLATLARLIVSTAKRAAPAALHQQEGAQGDALPIELMGVREEIKAGSGFWQSCSGCHDTEDGHPTGPYSYSSVFGCALGSGCSECGGLGAVWDNNDYEAWNSEDAAPAAQQAGAQPPTLHLSVALGDADVAALTKYTHDLTAWARQAGAQPVADEDGARWRFMMAVADNPNGPEADAMNRFAREPDHDDPRPESVQLTEIADRARASLSAPVVAGDKGGDRG